MKTTTYLDKIAEEKRREVEELIRLVDASPDHPLTKTLQSPRALTRRFSEALTTPGLSVIAEVKRRSPSKGNMAPIADPVALAQQYRQGGAAAISVLTDFTHFGGSLDDLKRVSSLPGLCTLRKDFIIHPLQIAEAALAGASAVLLITALLGDQLKRLMEVATRLGLEVLTEVHDRQELEQAIDAGASIIGVNNRNLHTFEVSLAVSEELRSYIPPGVIAIAESGISDIRDAQRMAAIDYDAILVGEMLVRSASPAQLIQEMRGCRHDS